MSETPAAPVPPPPVPSNDSLAGVADLRSLTLVCYVLYLLAVVTGLTAIIGLIIAYLKRREAAGTVWQSHFDNLILVFWVMAATVFLGMMTWPIALGAAWASWPYFWPSLSLPLVFGLIVFPVLAIWYFYRVIRGLIRAGEARPY